MSMVDTDSLPPEPPPMADPGGVPMPSAPPAWQPSVDLAALARGGMPAAPAQATPEQTDFSSQSRVAPIPQGVDIAQLSQQAAENKRAETAEKEKIRLEEEPRKAAYRAEMEKRFAQTAVNPEDYKPWDTATEQKKYETDPIQSFASIGSIFALAASAFTNRPMENSMMGMAAAMNAVKENDEQAYNRAYKAWQDNTNLAVKRQAAQHQSYGDAMSMVKTNMELAQQRTAEVATRYGDKQMLLLTENGLWDKAFDLLEKRNKLGLDVADTQNKTMIEGFRQQRLFEIERTTAPGSPEREQAIKTMQQAFSGKNVDVAAEIAQASINKHRGAPDFVEKVTADMDKWFASTSGKEAGGNLLIGDRLKKQAIVRETEKILAANPGMDTNKALFQASETVEQNMPGKVKERIAAQESVVNQIDAALQILDKYEGAGVTELTPTGLSGMVQRLGEWTGMASPDLDATNLWQKQQLIKAGLPVALPASIKGKLNKADRADFDAIVGTGNFTNVPQAKLLLQNLKRTINRAESLDTDNSKQSSALPVPEQYKSAQDGTRFPVTKNGATSIYVKQGNRLVPAQ